jgi:hypothetical protein
MFTPVRLVSSRRVRVLCAVSRESIRDKEGAIKRYIRLTWSIFDKDHRHSRGNRALIVILLL